MNIVKKEDKQMQVGDKSRVSSEFGGTVATVPLVTIITVVYNGAALLERTIQSVIDQSYRNVEYIIIDGGSTDGTLEIIARHESKITYWLSESDAGIYDAMNKGVKLASGEYVGIIGAGDYYDKDAISKAVATFLKTGADVVYGDVELVDAETNISRRRLSRSELMPITMSSISHPSLFTKRSIYLTRPFDTKFKIAADYDVFLGLYVGGYRFEHSQGMHVHIINGGVSSSFETQKEVYRVHLKHLGAIHSVRRFIYSAARYYFYRTRRWILGCILSPTRISTLRAKWLQFKAAKESRR